MSEPQDSRYLKLLTATKDTHTCSPIIQVCQLDDTHTIVSLSVASSLQAFFLPITVDVSDRADSFRLCPRSFSGDD